MWEEAKKKPGVSLEKHCQRAPVQLVGELTYVLWIQRACRRELVAIPLERDPSAHRDTQAGEGHPPHTRPLNMHVGTHTFTHRLCLSMRPKDSADAFRSLCNTIIAG